MRLPHLQEGLGPDAEMQLQASALLPMEWPQLTAQPETFCLRAFQDLRARGGRAPASSISSLQPVVLGTLGIQLEEERDVSSLSHLITASKSGCSWGPEKL